MKKHIIWFSLLVMMMCSFNSYAVTSNGVLTSPADTTIVSPTTKGLRVHELYGVVIQKNQYADILTGKTNAPSSKWKQEGNDLRLVYPNGESPCGELYYADDGTINVNYDWELVDGKWYAFDWNGFVSKGLIKDARLNKYYYMDEDTGAMRTGYHIYNGVMYYFDKDDGHLVSNQYGEAVG
jgi:hypothetical protein